MGNMSYCRFENTMNDLRDCLNHIHKECDNAYEKSARQDMIDLFWEVSVNCKGDIVEYVKNYG